MFVPDLMHEGEGGGWKAIFTHLIRICYAVRPGTIQTLNHWYILLAVAFQHISQLMFYNY